MAAILYPPLDGPLGNSYETGGRYIAQCVMIERCINAAIHVFMTGAQLPQFAKPDEPGAAAVRRLLHRSPLQQRLRFLSEIARDSGVLSQPKPLEKRIRQAFELRDKMAHNLFDVDVDGSLVWLDNLTQTPRTLPRSEFEAACTHAVAIYDECARVVRALEQLYVPGLAAPVPSQDL